MRLLSFLVIIFNTVISAIALGVSFTFFTNYSSVMIYLNFKESSLLWSVTFGVLILNLANSFFNFRTTYKLNKITFFRTQPSPAWLF